jgi:outer membrane biosynthesis protein TonB
VGRLFGGDDEKPVSPPAVKAATPKPAPRPHPAPAVAPKPAAQPEPEQTAQVAPAPTPSRQSAASGASLMSGAAPTVPTGSFDQRWGAMR